MTKHEQMHTLVVRHCDRWVYLLLQTWVLIYLKCVRHFISALVPNKALFKYQRCISLHVPDPSLVPTMLIKYDV